MVQKCMVVAALVLGIFVVFGFAPFEGFGSLREAGLGVALLAGAMLL